MRNVMVSLLLALLLALLYGSLNESQHTSELKSALLLLTDDDIDFFDGVYVDHGDSDK